MRLSLAVLVLLLICFVTAASAFDSGFSDRDIRGTYVVKTGGGNTVSLFSNLGLVIADGRGHFAGSVLNRAFPPEIACTWIVTGTYDVSRDGKAVFSITYTAPPGSPSACTGIPVSARSAKGLGNQASGIIISRDLVDVSFGGGAIGDGTLTRQVKPDRDRD